MPEITDAIRAAMAEAERNTDKLVEPAYAVLSDAERVALIDGLNAVKAALAA
jgi:DNA-binding MarR family transcriptional regulator